MTRFMPKSVTHLGGMLKEWGKYPIDEHLDAIAQAITDPEQNCCLVKAGAGSGKTTRVPPYLLPHFPQGKILILEPRRLAAKLTAARVAWFLGQELGESVGYMIRQDVKVSDNSRIIFITEGLFARLVRDDPSLSDVSLVILDEFHERNLHSDMALAMVRKIQQEKRADLKLLVMSATLEMSALENYLTGAALFDIPGELFPVECEYRPNLPVEGRRKSFYKKWEEHAADVVEEALKDPRSPQNLLVFLAGIGEIRTLEQVLNGRGVNRMAKILPLAGSLPANSQKEVFLLDGQRKVVLATNVAETSLTLPEISGVVDLGQAKIAAFAPWSGMPSLELQRISKASAIQRAGRAGRTGPGVVFRLYSQTEFAARSEFTPPDIERVELSHFVLDTLSLGHSIETMPWLTAPNERNLESSIKLLQLLGCIDQKEQLTKKGEWVLRVPLHPRLGVLIYHAENLGVGYLGVVAAAILSEGMLFKGVPWEDDEITSDLVLSMKLYLKQLGRHYSGHINQQTKERVEGLVVSLCRQLRIKIIKSGPWDEGRLSRAMLTAFPDRVAVRREVKKRKSFGPSYSFVMGKGGGLGERSVLLHEPPKFFIALDAMENPKMKGDRAIQVESGHPVSLEQLKVDPAQLTSINHEIEYNEKRGRPKITRHLHYGNLIIESRSVGEAEGEEELELTKLLAQIWPAPFTNDDDLKIYHQKLVLLDEVKHHHSFPYFHGEMLELLIDAICDGVEDLAQIKEHRLQHYIFEQLSAAEQDYFQSLFPSSITLDNGRSCSIKYQESTPIVILSIQELYGQLRPLTIINGSYPLRLQLLAPNGRVATVITDPARFWAESYPQLARELAGRYPKHYWPDRPATACPYRLKRDVRK